MSKGKGGERWTPLAGFELFVDEGDPAFADLFDDDEAEVETVDLRDEFPNVAKVVADAAKADSGKPNERRTP